MNLKFSKIILLLIPIFFTLSLVNAVDVVCCYQNNPNNPFISSFDNCPTGTTYVGLATQNQGGNVCASYKTNQVGCIQNDGSCTLKVGSGNIFKIGSLTIPSNANNYCVSYTNDLSSCSATSTGVLINGDNQIDSNGAILNPITNGNSNQIFDPNSPNYINTSDYLSSLAQSCSDQGSPFGFFVTKNSCESNDICLFNPHGGGNFKSYFNNFQDYKLDYYENSCIPKIMVSTCSNYKTKDNCENDRANKDLSCIWEEISDLDSESTLYPNSKGICVSTEIENKYYEKDKYYFRGNIVKNPSFELGLNHWTLNGENSLIVNDLVPFDGKKALNLINEESISQRINYVLGERQYYLISHIKYINLIPGSSIEVEFKEYDSENNLLASQKKTHVFNEKEKIYNKIIFDEVTFNEDIISLDLIIKTKGIDIKIDAISLEVASNYNSLSSNLQIYKQIQTIPKIASNCNICFNELEFNTCTQEKSDLLGDCSYMTTGVDVSYSDSLSKSGIIEENYLGSNLNKYYTQNPWESQSLSNSELFCEIYTHNNLSNSQGACESPNNYVNSNYGLFHPQKGNTLCKWSETYGCFKDSNNDNLADTLEARPVFLPRESNDLNWAFYTRDNNLGLSDFELSCDAMPPTFYAYLSGINAFGEEILISEGYDSLLGNVKLNFQASDYLPQACNDYSLESSSINIAVSTNDVTSFLVGQNQIQSSVFVKEILDESGEIIFQDGINSIDITAFDSSGNIGETYSFGSIDMDLNPPQISLVSPIVLNTSTSIGVVGDNVTLEYQVLEKSQIDSCSYSLTPLTQVSETYYDSTGNLEVIELENSYQILFDLPIYNSSPSGDGYILEVTCRDIFSQSSTFTNLLIADFNTDLKIISPYSFISYEYDYGYIKEKAQFNLVSKDNNLQSCEINLEDLTSQSIINNDLTQEAYLENVLEGFQIGEETYYTNITAYLDFSSVGLKTGYISCSDAFGNIFERNISYIFDPEKPVIKAKKNKNTLLKTSSLSLEETETEENLIDIRLVDTVYELAVKNNVSNYVNNTYFDGENYYLKPQELALHSNLIVKPIIELDIDGTYSKAISKIDISGISYNLENEIINIRNLASSVNTINYTIINNTPVAKLRFDFQDSKLGFTSLEEDFYKLDYNITYYDILNNSNEGLFSFYYDDVIPNFDFSGDIKTNENKIIYTDVEDPQILIEFNTEEYRTQSCNIILKDYGETLGNFEINSLNSELNFKLSQIYSDITLTEDVSRYSLEIDCYDVYGYNLNQGDYTLIYDITNPVIDEINLESSNVISFWNYPNPTFNDLKDNIEFKFNYSGDDKYFCSLEFKPTYITDYNCEDKININLSTQTGYALSNQLINIVSGQNSLEVFDSNSVCKRKPALFNTLATHQETSYNTYLEVTGSCEDRVGLKSNEYKFNISLNYFKPDINLVTINQSKGNINPIINSTGPFDRIDLVLKKGFDSYDILDLFDSNNNFIYTPLSNSISLLDVPDGNYELEFNAVSEMYQRASKKIIENLVIDNTNPSLNISVPSISLDSKVYTKDFNILINSEDSNNIDFITIKLDDEIIYLESNSLNKYYYDETYFSNLDNDSRILNGNKINYEILFSSKVFSENLQFEILVEDLYGNSNSKELTVYVDPSLDIKLINTLENSFEMSGNTFLTSLDAPIIRFNITAGNNANIGDVSCYITGFKDSLWSYNDLRDQATKSSLDNIDNTYSIDLSNVKNDDLVNFNLSKLERSIDGVNIPLQCDKQGQIVTFNFMIKKVNQLPDYVVIAKEDFYITNADNNVLDIELISVGPFNPITCEYWIGDSQRIPFTNSQISRTNEQIDLSQLNILSDGEYNLNVQCSDFLNVKGPIKTYLFKVVKDSPIQIFDKKIVNSNGEEFDFDSNNRFYVNTKEDLTFTFSSNYEDVKCSYDVVAVGLLNKVFGFVKSLLSFSNTEFISENPFEFKSSQTFSLGSKESVNLDLSCEGLSDVRYFINYRDNPIEVSLD